MSGLVVHLGLVQWHVYGIHEGDMLEPFYIGVTTNVGQRGGMHPKADTLVGEHIRSLLAQGRQCQMRVIRSFDDKAAAYAYKAELIRTSPDLLNIQETASLDTVRLIFPCPKLLADRITAEWHRRKLASKSETIRELLGEALK